MKVLYQRKELIKMTHYITTVDKRTSRTLSPRKSMGNRVSGTDLPKIIIYYQNNVHL